MIHVSEEANQVQMVQLGPRVTPKELVALREVFWKGLTEKGTRQIIVRLDQLGILTPALISLFVSAQNMADKKGARFCLAELRPRHLSFLKELHLDTYFQILDNNADPSPE